MDETLQLRLLGRPEIIRAGVSVTESLSNKGQAILYYLAVTSQPQPRSTLATLLWGDVPDDAARANLRKALSNLREKVGDYLDLDGQTVAFKPDRPYGLDVTDFVAKLEPGSSHLDVERLQEAVDLYRGDFLSGYYVRHAPDFETWMLAEQARLREMVVQALHTLAAYHTAQGEPMQGIASVRRLLSLEPWREEAHWQLMLLLAQSGQRSAALAQYELCRLVLAEELGVEPGSETKRLYEQIRAGELSRGAAPTGGFAQEQETLRVSPASRFTPAPPLNLPPQPTSFVGRTTELADIIRRLTDRDCRLLTLIGPGGIGKTRLAIQTAQAFIDHEAGADFFAHGVIFVPLAGVSSIGGMVSVMAEAASFTFYSNVPPRQQLLSYLREKNMLLILDNLEHLLASALSSPEEGKIGGAELISEILAVAPQVKILVTSREALNLQEAWFHPIEGMSFPPPARPRLRAAERERLQDKVGEGLEKYDAVQLFVQSANRARVGFSLATEQAHVVRICQLVEGMPLGIELAAAWLKVLPAAKIVQEIKRGLDILSARFRNASERHQSMRAVFEQSWQLLSEEEQAVLKRLAVFRGSFTQEAAEQVARASLLNLAVLVEKSLLRVTENGRYQMHELLRQFSGEKLASDPQAQAITRERHSAYYVGFLKAGEAMLTGPEQRQALAEIGQEVEHIELAWRGAVEQGYLAAIDQAVEGLYNFYQIVGRYQEGKEIFSNAITQLEASSRLAEHPEYKAVLNRLYARSGGFHYFLGNYETANEYLEGSLKLAYQPGEKAFILRMLGEVANMQGKRSVAEAYLGQSLAISREMGYLHGVAEALRGLTDAASNFGDFVAGRQLARECLAINRQLGRPVQIARALGLLAWPTNCLGGYQEAEAYWQESLAICQETGDQCGIAEGLNFLGWVAWCKGAVKLAEASAYHQKALAIYREIGHRRNLAMCLGDLTLTLGEMGEYEQAIQYGREGLALTEAMGNVDLMAYNLYALGAAACGLGDFQTSRDYLLNSVKISWDAQIIDHATIALFYLAMVLAKESDLAEVSELLKLQQKVKALELLTLVIGHPACWQPIKDRAARLQAQLEAELPADFVTNVEAQAQRESQTLEEIIKEILPSWNQS